MLSRSSMSISFDGSWAHCERVTSSWIKGRTVFSGISEIWNCDPWIDRMPTCLSSASQNSADCKAHLGSASPGARDVATEDPGCVI
jgi:hypothetical protein